jgi:hypothetical protein
MFNNDFETEQEYLAWCAWQHIQHRLDEATANDPKQTWLQWWKSKYGEWQRQVMERMEG